MNKELYEHALEWLNHNYSKARKLVGDGDSEIASLFYHQCDPVIYFLWDSGVLEYENFCELCNQHHNLFHEIFLSR